MYNTVGIKAAAAFNNNLLMICEMAIPLKYLGLDPANPTAFSYAIRLNGVRSNSMIIISGGPITPPTQNVMDQVQNQIITDPIQLYMIDPKDFWAEYTLAKKP
jgi:radical SAM superfamily enzyme with C-terminal helix-hairpin-helix motif